MIRGIGTDMIEVERVESKIRKESGFRELVFSPAEIAYCETKTNKYQHYAARFAAKEAFFKALGTGWVNGSAFNEVEIINDEKGKPELYLRQGTYDLMNTFRIKRIMVSLSHLDKMAVAFVVIESD
ncbi:MAG: holo-ACP synthase [Gemmatimonadaceae bacterium]|nr:holo-ACP synthase [Chitinophagaceae bacterium]